MNARRYVELLDSLCRKEHEETAFVRTLGENEKEDYVHNLIPKEYRMKTEAGLKPFGMVSKGGWGGYSPISDCYGFDDTRRPIAYIGRLGGNDVIIVKGDEKERDAISLHSKKLSPKGIPVFNDIATFRAAYERAAQSAASVL